jgi:hypothetical protein
MKRWLYASFAALGLAVACSGGRAAAQAPITFGRPQANPMGTPTVSPWINLGNGGNLGLSYYGLVRPQVQAQQSIRQLQQQQQLEQAQLAGLTGQTGLGGMPIITGHETRFMNYSTYFPTTGTGLGLRR